MQAATSAMFQEREGRKRRKPKLQPKLAFGSSKGGGDNLPLRAPECLMPTSIIITASCVVEPGSQRVCQEDYSFVYSHLGPECGYSPSLGATPCFSRILIPTSDPQAPSEPSRRPMQAAVSAMPQEHEGRKRPKRKLPKLAFGSSKGGGDNLPFCAPWCMMWTFFGILSASCVVEPGFQRVREGDYSFVYSHLGPECGYSLSSLGAAPCSSWVLVPTGDPQAPSEDTVRLGSEEEGTARGPLQEGRGAAPLPWQAELLSGRQTFPWPRSLKSLWPSPASSLLLPWLNVGKGKALVRGAQFPRAPVPHGGLCSHLHACRGEGTRPGQLCL